MLHEPFDVDEPRPGRIAELTRDRPLNVEAQPLLRSVSEKMQPATNAPEKFLAAAKKREFSRREQPGGDELMGVANTIDVLRNPEERVEVAQSPLALLDVGFDEITRRARAPDARFTFREFRGDEFRRRLRDDLGVEPLLKRLEQALVADDEPRLDERGADCHVGARLLQAFIDRARRVADLLLQVPQHIEERLDHLLHAWRRLVGEEEQEVDVRKGRKHAAPVAADCDNGRQLLAGLNRGEPARGHFKRHSQELVGLGAQRFRARSAGSAVFQRLARFIASGGKRRLQHLDRRPPERRGDRPRAVRAKRQAFPEAWLAPCPRAGAARRAGRGSGVPPREHEHLTSEVYSP